MSATRLMSDLPGWFFRVSLRRARRRRQRAVVGEPPREAIGPLRASGRAASTRSSPRRPGARAARVPARVRRKTSRCAWLPADQRQAAAPAWRAAPARGARPIRARGRGRAPTARSTSACSPVAPRRAPRARRGSPPRRPGSPAARRAEERVQRGEGQRRVAPGAQCATRRSSSQARAPTGHAVLAQAPEKRDGVGHVAEVPRSAPRAHLAVVEREDAVVVAPLQVEQREMPGHVEGEVVAARPGRPRALDPGEPVGGRGRRLSITCANRVQAPRRRRARRRRRAGPPVSACGKEPPPPSSSAKGRGQPITKAETRRGFVPPRRRAPAAAGSEGRRSMPGKVAPPLKAQRPARSLKARSRGGGGDRPRGRRASSKPGPPPHGSARRPRRPARPPSAASSGVPPRLAASAACAAASGHAGGRLQFAARQDQAGESPRARGPRCSPDRRRAPPSQRRARRPGGGRPPRKVACATGLGGVRVVAAVAQSVTVV